MAFVGFWMIPLVLPLALALQVLQKIFMFFGFDFLGWLGNPETMDKIFGFIGKVTEFVIVMWNAAEPYVMPVVERLKDFLN